MLMLGGGGGGGGRGGLEDEGRVRADTKTEPKIEKRRGKRKTKRDRNSMTGVNSVFVGIGCALSFFLKNFL